MNSRAMAYIRAHPWAILPAALREMIEIATLMPEGEPDAAAQQQPAPSRSGNIAVIPVQGRITQKPAIGFMGMLMGGASTEQLGAAVRRAVADSAVSAIVLDINSPGGSVYGVSELADTVYQARSVKPVVAVANSLAASAAYWIGSQATELVVTPSGEIGSIGVLMMHMDESAALEAEGLKVTWISAGRYKTEGNPAEPLSDDAREYLQGQVDDYYGMFVADVARGRPGGIGPATVRSDFGEGRTVLAQEAVRRRMADRVGTLGDTLQRLGASPASAARAEAERAEITADADLDMRRRRLRLTASRGAS